MNTTTDLATQVLHSAQQRVAQRIEAWEEETIDDQFVDVLRNVRLWVVNDRCVAASVPDTESGSLWSYVASDALDVFPSPDSARIKRVSPTEWHIAW